MTSPGPKLHRAARIEDRAHAVLERLLRRRGWTAQVIPYTGYGSDGVARVLGRVLLAAPGTPPGELKLGRGWRRFFAATAADVDVSVEVGGRTHQVTSARGGYVDVRLPAELEPGWAVATMHAEGSAPAEARLRIVGPSGLGIVSDIDDTVIITALPRPLVAAWNTFVRHEGGRRPVRGMPTLFREVARRHTDVPVVYLSTGPWNVAPVLQAFLDRHGYPPGPLLMTDWGPTAEGWFRSGREHKRRELRRLIDEIPHVQWLLVGDDGQHDPEIYAEAAAHSPDHIAAIAIRELSPGEQIRTHGLPDPIQEHGGRHPAPPPHTEVRAPDGFGLLTKLRALGVINS